MRGVESHHARSHSAGDPFFIHHPHHPIPGSPFLRMACHTIDRFSHSLPRCLNPSIPDSFHSDLALATATVIPLLLVAMAFEASITERWQKAIEASVKPDPSKAKSRAKHLIFYSTVTLLASAAAILMATFELLLRTNAPDPYMVGCLVFVVLATLTAIYTKVMSAIAVGLSSGTPSDPRLKNILGEIRNSWPRAAPATSPASVAPAADTPPPAAGADASES
jgi:hypothetical protein